MQWLGDYKEDDTVYFLWSTNDADGASVTRATDGTVQVYKDNGATQSTAGVTDTEDFDSLTGIHACTIDLSADAFYATGADYAVVLAGATIDSQTVNAVLAHFSIENRYKGVADALATYDPPTKAEMDTAIGLVTTNTDDLADGERLDLLVDAIKSKTDNLPADPADDSDIDSQLATIDSVVDAIKAVTDNLPDSGALNDLATVLTDTNELQTDWTDGGRLDLLVDAIKAVTDTLTLTAIADAVLKRGVANVEDAAEADSLAALILAALHFAFSGSTLTVKKTDDATTFDTYTVTTDSEADPVTGVAAP